MPINFHPGPGSILICDFSTGFQPPEMVKVRPIVVISPRRRIGGLVSVVPISSTPPIHAEPWHFQLPPGAYPPAHSPVWVKCDIVMTVSVSRLDRVKIKQNGKREYKTYQLSPADFAAVMTGVRAALGIT